MELGAIVGWTWGGPGVARNILDVIASLLLVTDVVALYKSYRTDDAFDKYFKKVTNADNGTETKH